MDWINVLARPKDLRIWKIWRNLNQGDGELQLPGEGQDDPTAWVISSQAPQSIPRTLAVAFCTLACLPEKDLVK